MDDNVEIWNNVDPSESEEEDEIHVHPDVLAELGAGAVLVLIPDMQGLEMYEPEMVASFQDGQEDVESEESEEEEQVQEEEQPTPPPADQSHSRQSRFAKNVKPSSGYWDWGNKLVRMSQESLAAPAPLEVFTHIPEKLRPKLKEQDVVGKKLFVFIRPQVRSKQGNIVKRHGFWPAEVTGIHDTYYVKCSYLGYTKEDLEELEFKADFVIHVSDLKTKYELDEKGVWEYAFPKKYGPEEDCGAEEVSGTQENAGNHETITIVDSEEEDDSESETEDEIEMENEDGLETVAEDGPTKLVASEEEDRPETDITKESDSEDDEVNVAEQYPWRTKNADILDRAQCSMNTQFRQASAKPEISEDAVLEFVKYKPKSVLEVRDIDHVNVFRTAVVVIWLGWRMQISMDRCEGGERTQVFVDPDWSEVHPEGWCERSGAPQGRKKLTPKRKKKTPRNETPTTSASANLINIGEVFEVVHPINLQEIVVGQVTKVLGDGYFLYKVVSEIDRNDMVAYANGKNEFHINLSSSNAMPCNSCKEAGFPLYLTPPVDWKQPESFSWEEYFRLTGKKPLKFPKETLKYTEDRESLWKTGMLVEASDVLHSDIVAPAIITRRLLNRLIKVHFLGWETEYDQWRPVEAPCVYPVGWCKFMGYPLSEPKGQFPVPYKEDFPPSFYKTLADKGK